MTNIIHDFLDKQYTTIEAVYVMIFILGFVGLGSYIFGDTVRIVFGVIFLLVAVYGFIRHKKQRSKNNDIIYNNE